ncbi:MAG: hypothetical protein ACN6OP_18265 [Pseudomonadales bacterium]
MQTELAATQLQAAEQVKAEAALARQLQQNRRMASRERTDRQRSALGLGSRRSQAKESPLRERA